MTSLSRGRSAFTVGIFALSGAFAFTALFLYATNRTIGADRTTIYIRLDAADGLQKGDAVLLRGVRVGEVKGVEFGARDVVVEARLLRSVPLSAHARAELVAADVFGRQSVVLRSSDKSGRILADGDTLRGRGPVSLTARFDQIGRRADRLLSDSTIDLLRGALDGAGGATSSATMAASRIGALALTADRLIADQRESLDSLVRETRLLARQLHKTTSAPELASMPARLDESAANLVSATSSMDTAAASLVRILSGLEAGQGSAGLMLRDTALYVRTNATLAALERLIDDVRENPKRYVTVRVF
jgi:phospholipid/cholesterol/gamma-HCH transport system substrate-binding protein